MYTKYFQNIKYIFMILYYINTDIHNDSLFSYVSDNKVDDTVMHLSYTDEIRQLR